MSIRLGLDAKAYRNKGTYDTPQWSEITNIKDVTLNLTSGEADVSTRGAGGWKATAKTLKDASVDFNMVWDPENEDFAAIKDSYFNNTTIDLFFLDGSVSSAGSQGLRAVCNVMQFTRNEPLEEALTVNVQVKPAYGSNHPTWVQVSGSSGA
jgi:hypothetical protein